MKYGPSIHRLTHRLTECPQEFLAEPYIRGRGTVRVHAVVADLMAELGAPLWSEKVFDKMIAREPAQRNWQRLLLIGAWLLFDPWFREHDGLEDGLWFEPAFRWLNEGLDDLSELVEAEACVTEPDRREELARRCLAALDLRPDGESHKQAQNRLATLDTVAQLALLRQSQDRQARADKLRKKMEEKRAAEAAARYSRE